MGAVVGDNGDLIEESRGGDPGVGAFDTAAASFCGHRNLRPPATQFPVVRNDYKRLQKIG